MASVLEDKLRDILSNMLKQSSVDTANVKVCRKTKDLVHGDFVVPKGVLDIDSKTVQRINLETTVQQETAGDVLPISRLSQDKYNSIIFYVDRDKAFRNIIQEAISAGEKYGFQPETRCDKVIVNPVDLHSNGAAAEGQSESPVSLTQLRAVILLKHLLQLLIANGYQAELAKFPKTENVQDILDVLQVESSSLSKQDLEKACEQVLTQAQVSVYREKLKHESGAEGKTEVSTDGEKKSVVLNLRQYAENKGLQLGRRGFDKNMNLVTVVLEDGSVSDVTKEAAMVELMDVSTAEYGSQVNPMAEGGDASAVCVHLVCQSQAYTQQQADLVWRICTHSPEPESLKQRHLVFGSVGRRKSTASVAMDAKEFYNVRYTQMTQAAMMKYGDHDQGAAWDDMIAGLSAASITFDILSTACTSQVQLDLSEDDSEGSVDNRSGPFILYNCARLATLLRSFQQQVEQGVYPPLPDPSEVNFQLLREEEEWSMALLYVYGFPRLVHDALSGWHQAPDIAVHVHTHKVAHFLLNFSKVLSSYYSRYHILGGPEAHLLPLMFARLSLMKAAHHILCNGIKLLGLQPFSQL